MSAPLHNPRLTREDDKLSLYVDETLLLTAYNAGDLSDAPEQTLSRFAYVQPGNDFAVLRSPIASGEVRIYDLRVLPILFGETAAAEMVTKVWRVLHAAHMTAAADTAYHAWSFVDAAALFGDRSDAPPPEKAPPIKPPMAQESIPLPAGDENHPFYALMRGRHTRYQYHEQLLTFEQLGAFLAYTARVQGFIAGTLYDTTQRLYPSAGAAYELELYIAASRCAGLDSGLYHYDPAHHALELLPFAEHPYTQLIATASALTGDQVDPVQVLILITARLARISWKHHALLLAQQNVGVLLQTFYLAAAALDLAPCALGNFPPDALDRAAHVPVMDEPLLGAFLLGSRADQP